MPAPYWVEKRLSYRQCDWTCQIALVKHALSLLLFRLLELLSEVTHGDEESVETELERAWWW